MKRWHEDYTVTYREWKKHHRHHVEQNVDHGNGGLYRNRMVGIDPWVIECPCDTQVGRFRKMDAWDCGIPRCWVCHHEKYYSREKRRDIVIADLKLKEGVEELNGLH